MSETAQLFVRRSEPTPCVPVVAGALPYGVSPTENGNLVLSTKAGLVPVQVGDVIVYHTDDVTPWEVLSAEAFAAQYVEYVATEEEAAELVGEGDGADDEVGE